MAYPGAHYLLAWGGSLFAEEAFSNSLRLGGANGAPSEASEQTMLTQAAAAISSLHASGSTAQEAVLTWAKLNRVGADGKYLNGYTNLYEYPGAGVPGGAASGNRLPPQISLVATLTTAVRRGLANKGRIFLPAPVYPIDATGRISEVQRDQMSANVRDLLTSLNGIDGLGSVIVASKVREGAWHTVNGVSIGRVYDTMRSRRTSLAEERQVPLAIAAGTGDAIF